MKDTTVEPLELPKPTPSPWDKTSLHLFLLAIKSTFDTTFMRIAIVALITVPSLYAGLYLWANIDPYGNMKNVPVALVNEDTGTTIGEESLNIGEQITSGLIEEKPFDLHITTKEEVESGVDSEKYFFAIVIPSSFSSDIATIYNSILVSDGEWDAPSQATIELLTNDANNFIIHTAADTVGSSLQNLVAKEVSVQLTQNLLIGLNKIHDELARAAQGAAQIADGVAKLNANTSAYQEGLTKLDTAIGQLQEGLSQLFEGSQQIADGNTTIDSYAKEVREIEEKVWIQWSQTILVDLTNLINNAAWLPEDQKEALLAILDDLSAKAGDFHDKLGDDLDKIDALADGSQQLEAGLQTVVNEIPQLLSGVKQLENSFQQFSDAIVELNSGVETLSDNLSAGYQQIPSLTNEQVEQVAEAVASPVAISDSSQVSAGGYAAGLLPFFFSLSAWVGAYVLFVVIVPFQRKVLEEKRNPVKTALVSYLVPASAGILQMTLLYCVVVFGLGLGPLHHGLSLLFMFLTSATFVMILFVLVALLDKVGLFSGLVLLVLQLTASGGTFPWQTTPQFFHVIHKIFPMSYAVDALRHTFSGGNLRLVTQDAVFLGAWFLVMSIVACVVAQRKLKRCAAENRVLLQTTSTTGDV